MWETVKFIRYNKEEERIKRSKEKRHGSADFLILHCGELRNNILKMMDQEIVTQLSYWRKYILSRNKVSGL